MDSNRGTIGDIAARPRLAQDASVHPPRSPGDPWVLERDGRHYYRVGPDMARLAGVLTGDYDNDELLAILGDRWTPNTLAGGLRKLAEMSLIDDGRQRSFSSRRISVVPPFTIQFSVVDPSRLLPPVAPLIRFLSRRPAQIFCWALIVGGLAALLVRFDNVRRLIDSPVPSGILLWLVVGGFVGTVIHELAHGATLMHFGAKPRRMGVMLFYLFPAFFCDVSDGWLLSHRFQRVRVALAGIFAQLICAGAAGITGALLPVSTGRDGLLLLAMGTYLAALINLVPFVKLDGYLALMSLYDIPNLRTSAMTDARSFIAHALYGAHRKATLSQRWIVPYGLACMVFPLYLVGGIAFALWGEIAQGAGVIGAVVVFTFLCALSFVIGKGFVRLQQVARAASASLLRMIAVNVALIAGLVVSLAVIQVPEKVPGYYRLDGTQAQLYIPMSAATDLIAAGQRVELLSNGVVLRTRLGAAWVEDVAAQSTSLPMSDVLPVAIDLGLDLNVVQFSLRIDETPDAEVGAARVVVGKQSLWGWLASRYVTPVTRLW